MEPKSTAVSAAKASNSPTMNAKITEFYDAHYTERQRKKSGLNVHRYLSEVARLVGPTDSVLDFGSGICELLSMLPAETKVGVEVNQASRAYASQLGYTVYADLQDIPAGTQFSRVVSTHAIEHTIAPASILRQMRERLQDDGLLILVLPLDDWRNRVQKSWRMDDVHKHLYTWTPNTLANLLIASGFKPVEVKVYTRAHPPLFGPQLLATGLYPLASWLTALLLKRRQIVATATKDY